MKVSELSGAELDYWTSRATGWSSEKPNRTEEVLEHGCFRSFKSVVGMDGYSFNPSTNWSQCGPLIEEYEISVSPTFLMSDAWSASDDRTAATLLGATPLIAACRCIVASVYGEEVDEQA